MWHADRDLGNTTMYLHNETFLSRVTMSLGKYSDKAITDIEYVSPLRRPVRV